jgi:hypothetical protein
MSSAFAHLRLLLLLALVLAASGCSTVRLAYNQADHLAAWMADDYFDLNGEQEDAFRERFQRLHAWHRGNELPVYAAVLDDVQQRLRAGARADDVAWLVGTVQSRYRALVEHGAADAAQLLATLSDAQVDAARRRCERANRKYARENGVGATAEEQRKLRARRHLERIEHWTGSLDAMQAERVRALSRALPLDADVRYVERLRRQAEFLDLLQARRDPGFASRLRAWLEEWQRSRGRNADAQLARLAAARAGMYVEVVGLLTPEQRRHVDDVIERYRSRFRELAKQAPAQQRIATQP